ncbi:MAG: RNA polymerase sigma factor [Clostridia bacterium]|jgi:RNA polymerase sigma factor, sigma-70 family|nr:RNA polymerase sigma factor [Clostridia bacterium]
MYELVLKAKKGDKEAFTELILQLEDDLYKIARTRLNNQEDIFDAIQETIISAYKSIGKLKKIEFFKTWIIKILINKCNDVYKNIYEVELDERKSSESDFSNSIVNLENDLDFEYIIKILNYDERIAMTLYYLEEYTTKEIGEILKTSENTIKTRIARARLKIKNNYKKGV